MEVKFKIQEMKWVHNIWVEWRMVGVEQKGGTCNFSSKPAKVWTGDCFGN